MILSTITLDDACREVWDIVVVGAGISGSIATREVARLGSRVLLVDKAVLPRRKVCGCFLNANALASMAQLDLSYVLVTAEAPSVHGVFISAGRRQAYLSLPTGAALSRHRLDEQLSHEAIAAGASLLMGTEAHLVDHVDDRRRLRLICADRAVEISCRIVIAADGLAAGLARETEGCTRSVHPHSRIGVSAATPFVPRGYEPGTIQMVIGHDGYIGSLQVEDGHLEIAASLDPVAIRRWGLAVTLQRILQHSPLPRLEGFTDLKWTGTPPLSSRTTPVASHRIFFVGDAAGYVEPFTGEGMAWAMASAAALAPIAHQAARHYSSDLAHRWIVARRRILNSRMRVCRLLTLSLRQHRLTELNLILLGHFPLLAKPFTTWLNRPHALPSVPM